jgi:O-antigen/teichoic acid export membrane protein
MRWRAYAEGALASAFVRHNAVLLVGSGAVAFLNYLYHPVLSRLLPLAAFGEVQTIVSLATQIALVLNVVGMVALHIVTNRDAGPERDALIRNLEGVTFYALVAVCGAIAVFAGALRDLFRFSSTLPFFFLALVLLATVSVTFRRSYLQAVHDFFGVSVANILIALGRLAFAVLFVIAGYGAAGALGALVAGNLLALAYLFLKTRGTDALRVGWRPAFSRELWRELRYAALALVCTAFILFLASADVLFAKRYFDPELAGAYSGISTVARIIFFATASVQTVLLPLIRLDDPPRMHRRLLYRSLALVVGLAAPVLAAFWLFPIAITRALVGEPFVPLAGLLPILGVVTLLTSVANLFTSYFIALRRYGALAVVAAGTLATVLPILATHEAPRDIAVGFLAGAATGVALFTAFFMRVALES